VSSGAAGEKINMPRCRRGKKRPTACQHTRIKYFKKLAGWAQERNSKINLFAPHPRAADIKMNSSLLNFAQV
jgi:hypothetical protein